MISGYNLFLDMQNQRVGLIHLKTGLIDYREFSLEYPYEYWQRVVEDQERWKKERANKDD